VSKFADYRTEWRGMQLSYDDLLIFPNDTRECNYCLTASQAEALLSVIELWRYRNRWYSDDEMDIELIRQFVNDTQRRLIMSCCGDEIPIQYMWNGDGVLEQSTDGGETWTPAPLFDPRQNSPQFPPVEGVDGDEKRCKSADGMVALIKEQVGDNLTDDMSRYTLQQLIETWVKTMLQTGNVFLALIQIATNQIFALVILTIRASLTTDVYDQLRCALYANMAADASFTDESAEAARVEVAAILPAAAGMFLQHLLWLLGRVGMTNLARAGAGEDGANCDCSPCLTEGWTVEFGTEIERTCDYIKVQNQFNAPDSRYHCQIKSPGQFVCAYIGIEYEVETSPAPVGNTCGVLWPNDLTESQPNINLCNGADATTGASGWIKFNLTV